MSEVVVTTSISTFRSWILPGKWSYIYRDSIHGIWSRHSAKVRIRFHTEVYHSAGILCIPFAGIEPQNELSLPVFRPRCLLIYLSR